MNMELVKNPSDASMFENRETFTIIRKSYKL